MFFSSEHLELEASLVTLQLHVTYNIYLSKDTSVVKFLLRSYQFLEI